MVAPDKQNERNAHSLINNPVHFNAQTDKKSR